MNLNMSYRKLISAGFAVSVLALGTALPRVCLAASGGDAVVAQVGDKKITLNDLEKSQPAQMLTARYRTYMAEHDALSKAIDDAILENEAKKEGVTVDQLIDKHVKGKFKEPSDEALRVYYDALNTDQPYDVVRPQMVDNLRQLREKKAREEYMKSLREKNKAVIFLEPPLVAEANVGNAPVTGPADAPVTIIEYADYECPYCQKAEPSLKKIREQYSGKVRFAYKSFPLPSHPHAQKAAEAALCAGQQGKYWDFHERVYEKNGKGLDVSELKELARSLGVNGDQFDKCLDSSAEAANVKQSLDEGLKLGVTGTPSFFINGHFISGSLPYDQLNDLVQLQLTKGKQTSSAGNSSAQMADR